MNYQCSAKTAIKSWLLAAFSTAVKRAHRNGHSIRVESRVKEGRHHGMDIFLLMVVKRHWQLVTKSFNNISQVLTKSYELVHCQAGIFVQIVTNVQGMNLNGLFNFI